MKSGGIGLLLFALAFAACADNAPSVLVKTEPIRQQPLVFGLSGYGVVSPAVGSAVNLTFPRAGEIQDLRVMPGQVVRHGDALFVFVTDPAAANGYAQAKSSLEFARSEYARVDRLFQQQLATRSQLAAAKKALLDAQSVVEEQARLGAGIRMDHVRAPFDGVVTELFAAQGDRVPPGKVVLQLARRGSWRVQIGLLPEDLYQVRVGMRVQLHAVLNPALKMEGIVDRMSAVVDPQTQLVNVSVKVIDTQNVVLVPGMKIRGLIQIQTVTTWVVPSSAVLRDEHGAYIYQSENGHARRVDVIARDDGALTGITGSIDPRLPVVVLGNYELKDGIALREGVP